MKFKKNKAIETKLPTNRDIIEYMLFLKDEGTARVPKNRQLIQYNPTVIAKLLELWQRANIPIIKRVSIRKKIKALVDKYHCFIKNSPHDPNEWSKLFRISICRCGIELNRRCNCSDAQQIPQTVQEFFIDQCGPRLLTLDEMPDHENRSESDVLTHTLPCAGVLPSTIGYAPSTISELEYDRTRRETSPQLQPKLKVSDIKLRNYSSGLDRTDTSNRAGALLATMLLKDIRTAIANKALKNDFSEDTSKKFLQLIDDIIIDKNKIHRERVNFRKEAKALSKSDDVLQCISFDGKKELTLKKQTVLNKVRMVQVLEEHVTLVKEPESKFIGYTTPDRGSGQEIQKAIVTFLAKEKFSMDHLVAISCDGTATNTGRYNGVISYMERYLQRPLQWFVCLFHFNELPLCALLRHFFGKQKGPGIWPEEFGKEIAECEKYNVAELFEPITMGAMPDNIDGWTLRADQRYLFQMVVSVNNGVCDECLASLKPGPLSTARWLTTAARILRLYVTKRDPSLILKKLTEFIVKVYAPFWFLIKEKPEAIHGSRNVFKYINWIRQLPMDVQLVIRQAIENNAYYFHPENILLSMITDTESSEAGIIRSDAYEKIIAARIDPPATIRTFYVPRKTINYESISYTEMIDWNKFNITEPPCLQFFLQCELEYHQYSNEIIKIPAGHSSENKNVAIWDTLLPMKKSGVASFSCHDQGSSSLVFVPQHQILISCGKKGDVCIFDIRQRMIRHRYQAHDSTIKCVALDPNEEYFVTGSTEGDIKIWSLTNFSSLFVFPGEHAKNSFFKHAGQGVSQLHLDAFGRLFSCGSDGCMKVRQLIEKDTIVQTVY